MKGVVWAVQTFKKVYIWGVLNRLGQKTKILEKRARPSK
nr:MAG TPA: hypothetical protein [Caudoviricetes sp.]